MNNIERVKELYGIDVTDINLNESNKSKSIITNSGILMRFAYFKGMNEVNTELSDTGMSVTSVNTATEIADSILCILHYYSILEEIGELSNTVLRLFKHSDNSIGIEFKGTDKEKIHIFINSINLLLSKDSIKRCIHLLRLSSGEVISELVKNYCEYFSILYLVSGYIRCKQVAIYDQNTESSKQYIVTKTKSSQVMPEIYDCETLELVDIGSSTADMIIAKLSLINS